jgi:hypothetical protein
VVSVSDALSLTGHELVSLLSMGEGPQAQASRRVLEYDDASADLQLLGLATLVARGLATMDATEVQPVGPAHHVAVALTTAESWLRVVVGAGEQLTVYVLLGAPQARVALRARELGIWEVTPLALDADLREVAVAAVGEVLAAVGRPALGTVRVDELDAAAWRSVSLRAPEDGDWEVLGPQREVDSRDEVTAAPEADATADWAVRVRAL